MFVHEGIGIQFFTRLLNGYSQLEIAKYEILHFQFTSTSLRITMIVSTTRKLDRKKVYNLFTQTTGPFPGLVRAVSTSTASSRGY